MELNSSWRKLKRKLNNVTMTWKMTINQDTNTTNMVMDWFTVDQDNTITTTRTFTLMRSLVPDPKPAMDLVGCNNPQW